MSHHALYAIQKKYNPPKCATAGTNNLQPVELLHLDFTFYNVTTIRGFTSMITDVREIKTMLWIFPTTSKQAPVIVIQH